MVFLELSIGQYTSTGTLGCWSMSPILSGIGISMNIANTLISIYYNMLIAYSLYYLVLSFQFQVYKYLIFLPIILKAQLSF